MRRSDRRANLLRCAQVVFAEKGYHAASISDIITRAKVARGTFYLYFESKRAVFEQLLDEVIALIAARVRRIDPTRGTDGVLAQLESNVHGVFESLLQERATSSLLVGQAVGLDPAFDLKLLEFFRRTLEMVERSLATGQEMKLVLPMDRRVAAMAILGSIKEILYHVAMGTPLPDPRALVEELLRFHVRALFVPAIAERVQSRATRGPR
jgi:AcrR family transcriptional regulator